MPEMTRYEHGVPSWVDIGTPDPSTSVRFYSDLFGWAGQDMGEEAGHYTIVSKDGKVMSYHNGILISTITEHEFKEPASIGFESEGSEIHWRNIRMKAE